jgi:predicted ATP-dependent endonuclease of OLD family
MQITKFTITGLFGSTDVAIPIKENKLVLVGVNGIGKSTVLNLFYLFISLRWDKLTEYSFDSIAVVVNDKTLAIRKNELLELNRATRSFRRYFPPAVINRNYEASVSLVLEYMKREPNWRDKPIVDLNLPHRLGVSNALMRRMLEELSSSEEASSTMGFENYFFVRRTLETELDATVLYLPTYRRIEKELSTIVPNIEDQARQFEDRSVELAEQAVQSKERKVPSYVELVQFGMSDVKRLIDRTLTSLNFSARQRLNALSGQYLRDIIREQFDSAALALNYPETEIRSIMDRVSEGSLDAQDKSILIETIRQMRSTHHVASERDKYLAHYFGKLVEFVQSLEQLEEPINKFVKVCNDNYLVGKKLVYDKTTFELSVNRTGSNASIELKDLSSGEKQVVSLFCHLYLNQAKAFIVLIDEPELSLSVDWQLSFLPDVTKTDRCKFLFAVTHSPFAYENELDGHTVDLSVTMEHRP